MSPSQIKAEILSLHDCEETIINGHNILCLVEPGVGREWKVYPLTEGVDGPGTHFYQKEEIDDLVNDLTE